MDSSESEKATKLIGENPVSPVKSLSALGKISGELDFVLDQIKQQTEGKQHLQDEIETTLKELYELEFEIVQLQTHEDQKNALELEKSNLTSDLDAVESKYRNLKKDEVDRFYKLAQDHKKTEEDIRDHEVAIKELESRLKETLLMMEDYEKDLFSETQSLEKEQSEVQNEIIELTEKTDAQRTQQENLREELEEIEYNEKMYNESLDLTNEQIANMKTTLQTLIQKDVTMEIEADEAFEDDEMMRMDPNVMYSPLSKSVFPGLASPPRPITQSHTPLTNRSTLKKSHMPSTKLDDHLSNLSDRIQSITARNRSKM
ncbi:hypothetical protein PCE1_002311 [Barthelona sp. PCE]